jgi:hypothetical protein
MSGIYVSAEYNEKHDWWILKHGNETFFNEKHEMMTWDTKQEAIDWARTNHPELTDKQFPTGG